MAFEMKEQWGLSDEAFKAFVDKMTPIQRYWAYNACGHDATKFRLEADAQARHNAMLGYIAQRARNDDDSAWNLEVAYEDAGLVRTAEVITLADRRPAEWRAEAVGPTAAFGG